MRRMVAALAVGMLMLSTGAQAQSPSPSTRTFCVTVSGPQVMSPTDMTERIVDGSLVIEAIGSECPAEGAPLSTVPPAADEPLPLEVVEFGFTPDRGDDFAQWAVIIRNPNPSRWIGGQTVSIDFLDSDGSVLSTTTETVVAIPGQTTALADTEFDAGGTETMEVRIGNAEDGWQEVEADTRGYEIAISDVRTRVEDRQPTTTGRATSNFDGAMEYVPIVVVYRNKAGAVIGGETTYIERLEEGQKASFKADGFTTYRNLGDTEVYWQVRGG